MLHSCLEEEITARQAPVAALTITSTLDIKHTAAMNTPPQKNKNKSHQVGSQCSWKNTFPGIFAGLRRVLGCL
jgi:hypothetical protein